MPSLAIFGYSPGELIGRRLSDLVSEAEAGLDGVPREGLGFRADGSSSTSRSRARSTSSRART